MGEASSGVFGPSSGEPPVADEVVEDLETSGESLSPDETTSALGLAMQMTSGMLLSYSLNEESAVRELGWVPNDGGQLRRKDPKAA